MIYEQKTGRFCRDNGKLLGVGYSGHGEGKNNPTLQHVHNVGPIPCGDYTIGPPRNSKKRGPYVLPLMPDPTNEMFERSAFLIHGDSIKTPGTASEGCIILSRKVREAIWASEDKRLKVIEEVLDGAV